jgi:hypothetical protein
MIEFALKNLTNPIPCRRWLEVVALVDGPDRQPRELLDRIAAEHVEIGMSGGLDRDVPEDAGGPCRCLDTSATPCRP